MRPASMELPADSGWAPRPLVGRHWLMGLVQISQANDPWKAWLCSLRLHLLNHYAHHPASQILCSSTLANLVVLHDLLYCFMAVLRAANWLLPSAGNFCYGKSLLTAKRPDLPRVVSSGRVDALEALNFCQPSLRTPNQGWKWKNLLRATPQYLMRCRFLRYLISICLKLLFRSQITSSNASFDHRHHQHFEFRSSSPKIV